MENNLKETKDLKEKLEDLKNESSDDKQSTKKETRGRKSKEELKEKFESENSGVGKLFLSLIIPRLPNPKPVSEEEEIAFDKFLMRVLYKHQDRMRGYNEEFMLLVTSASIFLPRLEKPEKEIKKDIDETVKKKVNAINKQN